MKKREKVAESQYVYFNKSEETVIRENTELKQEIEKKIKKSRQKKIILTAVYFVSAFAILLSGSFLAKRGIERFLVLRNETKSNTERALPQNISSLNDDAEKWAYIYETHPELMDFKFPAGILPDYALYYAENQQTIGYIRLKGTQIDYPVVQAENNKYYLNHDFYGKTTSYGSIYASCVDDFQPLDRNTLLYGHNMYDGSRFAVLMNYKNLDYYREHPVIEFDTLFEKHKWKIAAVYVTNGSVDSDNGYFFDFTFDNCSDTCFDQYIEELSKRSLYDTGIDIQRSDTILTLCTCSYEFDDARLVVVARMLRDGESEKINKADSAYKMTAVKYPSSYYDNPRKNPYKDDPKWYLY